MLCVYTSWHDDQSIAGVYVNFSSDDGGSWLPSGSETQVDGGVPVRPIIATYNPSGTANGNTYIAWTDYNAGEKVRFAAITPGAATVSNLQTIPTATSGSTTDASACDIAVDFEGNVYVLWRETHFTVTPNTRDFYISESTDGGADWTKYTVVTGSVTPAMVPPTGVDDYGEYQDYPCMAISKFGCSENLYVAFTAKPSLPATNGPSDLYLDESPLPLSLLEPEWSSPATIAADAVSQGSDGNSNPYWFQFEPSMAPDGCGGVFLLYYSSQTAGSPQYPCATLYESGYDNYYGVSPSYDSRGPQISLSTPSSDAVTHDVSDYVGIAWDPVNQVAHPIWTDYIPSKGYQGTFTTSISPAPLSWTDPTIAQGDLGFSNQRKIVMTGNTAHIIGYGAVPPFGDVGISQRLSYSEQTSSNNGTSAANWSVPVDISQWDIYGDGHQTYWWDGSEAAIGVYERGGSSNQKALAVVWTTEGQTTPGTFRVYIRVKEYDTTETGTYCDWSFVDHIDLSGTYEPGTAHTPVIAPLTKPVPGSTKGERYLLGWVITFPNYNGTSSVNSVTYLRGLTTGTEGASPGVQTENENWGATLGFPLNIWGESCPNPNTGTYFAGSWAGATSGVNYQGTASALDQVSLPPGARFVSVTSNECNGYGLTGMSGDITGSAESQTVVYTGDPSLGGPNLGVWALSPTYQTTANSTPPLGEAMSSAGFTLTQISSPSVLAPSRTYASLDRNPSVTITSAGQKLVAWEHMEGSTFVRQWWQPLFDASSIRLAQTSQNGSWTTSTKIQDRISEGSLDLSFTWLRNPSITGFPKSLIGASKDPAAAELLYWMQKKVVPTGNPTGPQWTWNEVDGLHERRFWLASQANPLIPGSWWTGQWYPLDMKNGDPHGWGPFTGANSQKSFGVYNDGPSWPNSWPAIPKGNQTLPNPTVLTDGATNLIPYNSNVFPNHGFSYSIGNAVTFSGGVGTIQPTLTSPTPDIGALKGTFDTALGVQFYRSETRAMDSSEVSFIWGKVYVEDTALNLPIREIMLHNGQPDSNGFVSHDAMRDSIFATEWFDWPVSAEIKYDRMMIMPVAGTFASAVDTNFWYASLLDSTVVDSIVTYDTVLDSVMVLDTVRGAFTPDTTYRADKDFLTSDAQMKYTVQLIHSDGHIDTVDQAIYNPSEGLFIAPMTVTIANAGDLGDTVMLQVLGDFTNVPDADSNVGFARETTLDSMVYQTLGDTTLAVGSGGGVLAPPDTCFSVLGPYSNPSNPGANDVSILVHYCGTGVLITAQVYDYLGNPIGAPSIYSSDEQIWDRLPITAPGTPGTYYIQVTVGSYSNTSGYSVY
ncbi:MAG TPA: hypothetical protein VFH95_08510 [Candidatus Kapabacteria bacterium]|nr:hypothetical protein [Candidatus Kapabacteria bacterium]